MSTDTISMGTGSGVTLVNVGGGNIATLDGIMMSATTGSGAKTAHAGDLVTITMASAAPMNVTGQPTLLLNDHQAAAYVSGSGTDALTFVYVVQTGDTTADLQVTGIGNTNGSSIEGTSNGGLQQVTTLPSNGGPVEIIFTGPNTPHPITLFGTHDLHLHVDTTTTPPPSVQQEVMGLYAALCGRAAESSGFSYWVGLVGQQSDAAGLTAANAGVTPITLSDAAMLGQNFVSSQNTFFNATYGALTDSQFVRAIYQNIGGSAGDSGGISYWASLLADAETNGQSAQAARAGIAGQFVGALIGFDTATRPVGLSDQQWSDAQTRTQTINNKIAVSTAYASACAQTGGDVLIPHAVNDAAYQAAAAVLQSVTADPNSVAVALAGIANAVAHHDLGLI